MYSPFQESILNTHPNHEGEENKLFGYQISQTDEVVRRALGHALELLKKVRWTGAETRIWTAQVEIDTKQRIRDLGQKGFGSGVFAVEKKIREITEWENTILHTIRRYMTESNDLINQTKTLNPPLTTDLLKPFIQAMQKDRDRTIATLNPLAKNIDELATVKMNWRQGRSPILSYSPLP